jgi:hypothetical protein
MDTKAIEEKAINYLKIFIEDSDVISQYIDDNDKEPSWDGHLFLYREGGRDKNHFVGRVPVQVKGTVVKKIKTDGFKYKLEKVDLLAYLQEPTFFVVCQIEEGTNKKKLFYRELLPTTVRNILKGIGGGKSRMTKFKPFPDKLKDFEAQLIVFNHNSKKMVSFADKPLYTLHDAVLKGMKQFSFITPVKYANKLELYKYLSTTPVQLFADVKECNIEIPIAISESEDIDGIMFKFFKKIREDVKVGDRVFFNCFRSEIVDGHIITNVGDVLTFDTPIENANAQNSKVNFSSKTKFLEESIRDAELVISLFEEGVLKLGDLDIHLRVNQPQKIGTLRSKLDSWKKLKLLLDKLHVTKPFDLTQISEEQGPLIDMLISAILNGEKIYLPEQENSVILFEISNVKILLWCNADENHMCQFGDFFDGDITVSCKYDDKTINVSPYSFLRNDHLWETCDNIDYEKILPCVEKLSLKQCDNGFHIVNGDILAMIAAYDSLENTDKDKGNKLLDCAYQLTDLLINKYDAVKLKQYPIIICNKMQIIKRQREFGEVELTKMEEYVADPNIDDSIKAGMCLLLEKKELFNKHFDKLSRTEQDTIRNYPIWRFHDSAK